MFGTDRPKYIRPGDEPLYPARSKDGNIDLLIKSDSDSALAIDKDAKTDFVYNRYHHLPLETQRQKLPIFQYRNHILYLLENHQTLVLVGETGSGKSTQIPQYLLEVGHRVCVTQPRVSAALALAARVAHERGCLPGQDVGYAVSMGTCRSPRTGIVFVTEGVLLREMFASPLLTHYSCIVLDEVHERSQLTDVLLGLLKKIARKRKNLKIVVSSATMDAEFLRDFFTSRAGAPHCRAAVLSVRGRTHPVDVFYAEEPVADYVRATVDTVIKIHENEPFGDVLAFLTSQEEILTALESLSSYAEDNNEKNKHRKRFPSGITAADLLVLPMYGSLPHHRQVKVFQMAGGNTRKVVLATNIAETSVTIPGIVYVVDCGFQKLPYMDPALDAECTAVAPVARNNAIQRAGRCGRTAPGKCYRLYTEEEYERLAPCVPPELARSDLSAALLQLKALGIHNLLRFTFPTPPSAKALLAGLELLYALGAVGAAGALTPLGERMAELPLRPTLAKVLCTSGEYGCIEEALSIVSMLQVERVFAGAGGGKENIAARISRRNNFEVAEGDIIMYLNVYEAYARVKSSHDDERGRRRACRAWCARRHVSDRAMDKVCEIRGSLEKLVKEKFKMENAHFEGPDMGTGKCERVMKCVLSGLFPQAARLHIDGAYRGMRGATLHISPDSCLYDALQPSWVVFGGVQSASGRTYMRELMVVRKEWLLEVAPHYYKET